LGKFHLDLLSDESHSLLLSFFRIISIVYNTLVGWKEVYINVYTLLSVVC